VSLELRRQLIDATLAMNASGINSGTSGNLSLRCGQGMLITPSGMEYTELEVTDIVELDPRGETESHRKPSSEWRIHHDIYQRREDALAIVHAHPVHCAALACLNRGIPPFHYMVAKAGGRDIRCSPYATFGTQELSDHVLAALQDRKACLMANHGLMALGNTLKDALALAIEVENLARTYLQCLSAGEPVILDDEEMDRVVEKFKTYGGQASN
jgi:L-fuculose-phosphate aldolase